MTTGPTAVFVVTCGRCGQTWQRTNGSNNQPLECVFCGGLGRLRLGALPCGPPSGSIARVEAWLECTKT